MRIQTHGMLNNGNLITQPQSYKIIARYQDVVHGQTVTVTRYESKDPTPAPTVIYPVSTLNDYLTIEELLERENND